MSPRLRMRQDLQIAQGYFSPQINSSVKLNNNESPYEPPQKWIDELSENVKRIQFNRYPDRDATQLRKALADLNHVSQDNIFCANGSNEVIQALLLAYGGSRRAALIFEPTYLLHSHIARITGTNLISGERNQDFRIDPIYARMLIDSTSPDILFLCSPNNPTGLCETQDTLTEIYQAAPGLVIIDEAYGEFASWNAIDLFNVTSSDDRIAIVRTFSKAWSLSSLRLGYLIASSEIIAACQAVTLPYHLDAVSQLGGRLALKYTDDLHDRVQSIVASRIHLIEQLQRLDVKVLESESNFVTFRPMVVDAEEVFNRLVEQSVLIRRCNSWDTLQGYLRVTVGTHDENLVFLTALESALK